MTLETTAPPATDFQPTIVQSQPLSVSQRLVSLDIFRGITIAAMLLVNNAGKGNVYAPLEHATWDGWTPTDLIFPFFLFIVGVATPFSLAKRASQDRDRLKLLAGIWIRALSIFLLGSLLQAIPFNQMDALPEGYIGLKILRIVTWVFCFAAIVAILFPWKQTSLRAWILLGVTVIYLLLAFAMYWVEKHAVASGLPEKFSFGNGLFTPHKLRIPGVLQRIGVCYGIAATIALFTGWRTILFAAFVFMAVYSAAMLRAHYHDHVTGSLTNEDNLEGQIDIGVFGRGHIYTQYGDPEGLLSTLPATATALLGILAGLWLRGGRMPIEKCAGLLANGVWVAILGVCLSAWLMPINKKIWTPSFVVFTAGMAMLGLGMIYWFADIRGRRAWAWPFRVFGVNAIAAFVVAGIVTRIGYMVKLDEPSAAKKVSLTTFCQNRCEDGVHHFSNWLQHSAHLPRIDTSSNIALSYSIGYVIVILLIMSILYVFKIYLKV